MTSTQPLPVDATITAETNGVVIRLQRTRAAYTVTVERTFRVAALCATFPTEPTARVYARRVWVDLRAGLTPEQIAVRLNYQLAA